MSINEENLPYKEKIVLNGWPNVTDIDSYKAMHTKSLSNIEEFWANVAKELEWFKPWDKVLVADPQPPFYKWFVGGRLNASYLAVDRHVKTWRRIELAIIWEGEPMDSSSNPTEVRKLTYYDLYREFNRLAYAIKEKLDLRKGDTVTIYLPMVPELPILMPALARLGVIFSFSGFSAPAPADKIIVQVKGCVHG